MKENKMEFTSEMKKIYKSIKRGFSSFFKKLGFNKKESENIAKFTCENVTKTWKEMGVNENIINEWNSIAIDASREGKKKQISSPINPQIIAPHQKTPSKIKEIFSSLDKTKQNQDIEIERE